ncbi:MAG: fibronectin type III domain-containing protein [Thermomicrobiales bacterium]
MRVHGRSRRLRRQTAWSLLAVTALFGAVLTAWIAGPASAAAGFASPLFMTKWQTDEAVTTNFWGPLQNARDGQPEPYVEGTYNGATGQRLVQYFDKGRMELTNPTNGTVTSGLLATELITGKLQSGDNTFQQLQPAAIPIAGDPDNIGPTYASISANATTLQAAATSTPGVAVSRSLGPTGTLGNYTGAYASDPQANIATFDATTTHNVPAAFLNFRNKVNLLNIGFAIAEPFWSTVKVAGTQKDVLVQAFERRVLTYTPTNNDPFKVEFGNIGQHYYSWRQSPQTQATPTPSVTAIPTAVADTTPPKFISEPKVEYVTPYSFTLTWSTDKPSSSEVKYGTSSNYASINDKQKTYLYTDHQVVVSGLTSGTLYHYRVQSRDSRGNLAVDSQDRTVMIPSTAAVVPVLSGITVHQTTTTFTVTWTTNINAYSRVEYGRGGVYDGFRKGDGNDPFGTTHSATAISLDPSTIYTFRIVSAIPTQGNDPFIAVASDEGPSPYANPTVQTNAVVSNIKISGLTAVQDKGGQPTNIQLTTDRRASVVIEIGSTSKLGEGYIFGPAADYPYPFTRNLHSIAINLPPNVTFYYRVTAYDEQGIGTTDIGSYTTT